MRTMLPPESGIKVSSAGTRAEIEPMHPAVIATLNEYGIDPSPHRQRPLSRAILDAQDLVIGMSPDHISYLRDEFQKEAMLFYEASHNETRSFPDIWDAVPDYPANVEATNAYLQQSVRLIYETMPLIIKRLPDLLGPKAL